MCWAIFPDTLRKQFHLLHSSNVKPYVTQFTLESVPSFDKYASLSSLAFQIDSGLFRTLRMTEVNGFLESAVSYFLDAYFTTCSPTKLPEIKMPFFDLPITLFTFKVLRTDFHELLFLNA